mmetsp:Transcript_38928/g.93673  ORF Transcript_38928/g.93673 Transcript_38928/m.93673 type:complete len:471 (-) Transcript_38928:653-2065(-)
MKLINALAPLGLLLAAANGDNDGQKQLHRDLPEQFSEKDNCDDIKDTIMVDGTIAIPFISGQLMSIDTDEDGVGDYLMGTVVVEIDGGSLAVVKIDQSKLTIRAHKVEIEINLETVEVMGKQVGGDPFAPARDLFSYLVRYHQTDLPKFIDPESDLHLLSKTMKALALLTNLPTDQFNVYAAVYNAVSNCPIQNVKALVECAYDIETKSFDACFDLGPITKKAAPVCQRSLVSLEQVVFEKGYRPPGGAAEKVCDKMASATYYRIPTIYDLRFQSQTQKRCVDYRDLIIFDDKVADLLVAAGDARISGQFVLNYTKNRKQLVDNRGEPDCFGTIVVEFDDGGLAVAKCNQSKITVRSRKFELELWDQNYVHGENILKRLSFPPEVSRLSLARAASTFFGLLTGYGQPRLFSKDDDESESELIILSKTSSILLIAIASEFLSRQLEGWFLQLSDAMFFSLFYRFYLEQILS